MASIYKRNCDKGKKGRPWMIAYTDEHGRRRTVTGSTDKAVTQEIAREFESKVMRRRFGVTNADDDRYASEGDRDLAEHLTEYYEHCEHVRMAGRTVGQKRNHLDAFVAMSRATRLAHLDTNSFERYLHGLRKEGLAARTVNHRRQDIVAFMNWCVKTGRLRSNPLARVAKAEERVDRRRQRRALSVEELSWLIGQTVHEDQRHAKRKYTPRHVVYLVAALTGLRRGEMGKITWSDVDLDQRSLRVRISVGKAKREDVIPLHLAAIDALASIRPEAPEPNGPVFPTMPTIRTFYSDLDKARRDWIEAAESDEDREARTASDFLKQTDSEGRVVDFHAMRTTLGTSLARAGVAPQLAQQIMRHSDYRTTLSHYTVLGLSDTTRAIDGLPGVAAPGAARRQLSNAVGRAPLPFGGGETAADDGQSADGEVLQFAGFSTALHPHASAETGKRVTGVEPATFSLGTL